MAGWRGGSARTRVRADLAVDVGIAAGAVVTVVYALDLTSRYWFWVDDWLVIRQAGSTQGFVEHYNGHLSLIVLALYRASFEVFGFAYEPLRLLIITTLVAVPVAFYVVNRRLAGAIPAAALAIALLSGETISFMVPELSHCLVLLAAIACAEALRRGPRADPWLAAALSFALASAGGGVAVAAACIVHSACRRAPVRRWIAVLGPTGAWATWWLLEARSYGSGTTITVDAVASAWDVLWATFSSAAFHNRVLGAVLLVAYVAVGLLQLRSGLVRSARWLAWTAAVLTWTIGVAVNREELADPHAFRYQLVAATFLALAVVPERPREPRHQGPAERRWALALLAAYVVLQGAGIAREGRTTSDLITAASTLNRGRVIVVELGPTVVADSTRLPLDMGRLRAGEVRDLLHRWGWTAPPAPDRALVEVGAAAAYPLDGLEGCRPISGVLTLAPADGPLTRIVADELPVTVEVRRFGDAWTTLTDLGPGDGVVVRLPFLASDVPWQVRAEGGCRPGR